MTEEIIIDENPNNKDEEKEINCLHFKCRKGENGSVFLWCYFYDDHCDNYEGCYFRKYLRLKQENETLTRENENRNDWITSLNKKCEELIKEKLNYRSALEEIKKIAKLINEGRGYPQELSSRILKKIREVLGC